MARRAAVVAAVAAAVGIVLFLEAPVCPVAFFFGVPCPGCGLTRAGLALLRGDLRAAVGFHPLAPVAIPAVALILGSSTWSWIRGRGWGVGESRIAGWIAVALGVVVLGVWIARFFGAFGGPVAVR